MGTCALRPPRLPKQAAFYVDMQASTVFPSVPFDRSKFLW
ncbi:hypothetical protein CHCC20335_0194 [Bacillus paralicheniformis]|nr:hypothetical protein CHCC20335_0194 [Bacillus paralicheniformis]